MSAFGFVLGELDNVEVCVKRMVGKGKAKARLIRPPKQGNGMVLGPSDGYEWSKTVVADNIFLYTAKTKVPTLSFSYEMINKASKPIHFSLIFTGSKNFIALTATGEEVFIKNVCFDFFLQIIPNYIPS